MRSTTFIIAVMLALLAGCLPTAKEQTCGSGSVFNSTSRTCVPVTSGGSTSGISIGSRAPIVSNVTVAQGQLDTTLFTVTVNNPLNQGFEIRWRLYPPSGVSYSSSPVQVNTNLASSNYGLVPNNLGLVPGLWTLAAEIYAIPSNVLATSAQWALTVTGAPVPKLALNTSLSSVSGTSFSVLTNALTATRLAVNVTDVPLSTTPWQLYWSFNGTVASFGPVSWSGARVATLGNNQAPLFLEAGATPFPNDNPLTVGPHVVRAELRSPSGVVYDSIQWSIYAYAPNMPQLAAAPFEPVPSTSMVVTAIDGVSLQNGGFRSCDSAACNLYNAAIGAGAFCVAVNSATGSGAGVRLQFKKNGINIGGPQVFGSANSYICLDDFAPTESLALSNPNIGEFRTISADVIDVGTSQVAVTVSWGVSIRPRNTAPTISNQSPAASLVVLQDTAQTYSFTAADGDTPSDLMDVFFELNGVALDGINTFPGTDVVTPNCTRLSGSGPTGAARLQCNLTIPSWGATGRINPATVSNNLRVYVRDVGVNLGAAQTSNIINWNITPLNPLAPLIKQTVPSIAVQGASLANNSYVTTLAAPTTILNPAVDVVAEGSDIVFSVLVNDIERDNFTIQIDRCANLGCTTTVPAVAPTLVSRNSNSLGRRVALTYNLPEDTVTGVAQATVSYRVTVKDVLPDIDGNAGTDTDSQTSPAGVNVAQTSLLDVRVSNRNPFPLWAGAASATPGLGDARDVVVGFPLTIDPGGVTDASVADGNVIHYRWQVKVNATPWATIPGATSRVLRWTPSQASVGQALQFRLCLGDDGFGNDVNTLCEQVGNPTAPAAPATTRFAGPWTGVVPRANKIDRNAALPTPTGEVATWFDEVDREFYIAYVNKSGTNDSRIVVERFSVAANGSMSRTGNVSFTSERTGSNYDVSQLSITGQRRVDGATTYKGLYVSYVTQDAPSVAPRIRLRRINLTGGEMIFTYNNFFEAQLATSNVQALTGAVAGQVTLQVVNTFFDASDYIVIGGIRLNPVTTIPANDCEFRTGGTLTTDDVILNIANAYNACASGDPRAFIPSGTLVGNQWVITNFPQEFVDLDYSVYLGKIGELMLHDTSLLIPYLDNTNSGRVAIAVVQTVMNGLAAGSLGRTSFPYSQVPTYVALNGTAQGLEISNSFADTGLLDVAIKTVGNGVNLYRLSFNAPDTVGIVASNLNVFTSSEIVSKPRIATGPAATNNHVFVLAQNEASPGKELVFARIDVGASYALAANMPQLNFDIGLERGENLTDYQIRALATNKRAALATFNDERRIYISVLRPEAALSELAMARPIYNTGYPAVDELPAFPTNTVPNLALSFPLNFTVGSAGATAGENTRTSVLLVHPSSGDGVAATLLNLVEESIQATANGTGFQHPYVK